MSKVNLSLLPNLLADEQAADAIRHEYQKILGSCEWGLLIKGAVQDGLLSSDDAQTVYVGSVNAWMESLKDEIWSSISLYDPLYPDIGAHLENRLSEIPEALKLRMSADMKRHWDTNSMEWRVEQLKAEDGANSPGERLLFAYADLLFFGQDGNGGRPYLCEAAISARDSWKSANATTASEKEIQERKQAPHETYIQKLESLEEAYLLGDADRRQFEALILEGKGLYPNSGVFFPSWVQEEEKQIGGHSAALIIVNDTKKRRHVLDHEFDVATEEYGFKPDAVWSALMKAAIEGDKNYPALVGVTEEGIQYMGKRFEDSGDYDVLTKKQCAERLRKRLKKHS